MVGHGRETINDAGYIFCVYTNTSLSAVGQKQSIYWQEDLSSGPTENRENISAGWGVRNNILQ